MKASENKKATLKNMQYQWEMEEDHHETEKQIEPTFKKRQYQWESEEDTFNHATVHQCETCHNSS